MSSNPWEWDEPTWRGKVEAVRAGRSLLPERWPNGARCAVALSFDSDHETNELRDGGDSVARLSWGEYGTRRGIPRIRSVLDRFGAKASFFVPAVSALLHPEEQASLAAEGHEIGLHGWIHERNRRPARGDAHTVVGLFPGDAADRAGAGAALRQFALCR